MDKKALRVIRPLFYVIVLFLAVRSVFRWHQKNQLIEAVKQGNTVTVKALLEQGFDPNMKVKEGDPPFERSLLQLAFWKEPKDYNTALILVEAGAKPTEFCAAIENTRLVKAMIKHGADVNQPETSARWTPLLFASQYNNPDVLKLLIEHGADTNTRNNRNEETPLVISAKYKHLDNIKFLISNGAEVNPVGTICTPLRWAVTYGDIPMIKYLLEKGADPLLADTSGATPLKHALSIKTAPYPDIVKMLQKYQQEKVSISKSTK